MAYRDRNEEPRCSFCHKGESDGVRLVQGPGVYICSDCVSLCSQILRNEGLFDVDEYDDNSFSMENFEILRPVEIKEHLDKYVIGQDSAKIALSVAVYNH